MGKSRQKASKSRRSQLLFAAAAVAVFPALAAAQDNWNGGGGADNNWLDSTNWSEGFAPTSGQNADIAPSTTSSFTANYDQSSLSLTTLTLDSSNSSVFGPDTLLMAADSLSAVADYVGYSGAGIFNQSGGTNTVSNSGADFFLGYTLGSTGTYILGGISTLAPELDVTGKERIGQSGLGIFNQSEGTNEISGNLDLAYQATATGEYTLSSLAILTASGNEYIGDEGTGTFYQTGGTNLLTSSSSALYLGNNTNSTGTYFLVAGTLSPTSGGSEYVGYVGTGIFNQSGGANTLGVGDFLSVGVEIDSTGTYILSNTGVLSAFAEYVGASGLGAFNQSGGTNTINGTAAFISIGADAGGTGTYNLSNNGTLSAGGGAIEGIGAYGVGNFNQTGGANTISDGVDTTALYVGINTGSTGTYTLVGGTLSVTGSEVIGFSSAGNFNQSGGINTITDGGTTALFIASNVTSTATYALSSGTLSSSGDELVGIEGLGFFNQSGGLNTIITDGNLIICDTPIPHLVINPNLIAVAGTVANSQGTAPSEDTYSLSDGTLSVSGSEFVGYQGAGIFNQSGGANNNSGLLYIGDTAVGTTGDYIQSGGTNAITGADGSGASLYMGYNAGATGSYLLCGTGALITSRGEYVGYSGVGLFNQSGGTNTTGTAGEGGSLIIGTGIGSTGTYTLSGGTINAAAGEYVGFQGLGNFNQSGGTNTLVPGNSNLYIGSNAGSTGSYSLSGGALMVSGNVYVGGTSSGSGGTGTLTLTNTGQMTVTGSFTQYSGSVSALNEEVGGGFPANASIVIGSNNAGVVGIFNQTGGTNTINTYAGSLQVGSNNPGTYLLSNGTLSVAGDEFVSDPGTGIFNQSGGANTEDMDLYMGFFNGSTGTYYLSGTGSLSVAGNEYVAFAGTGIINQSGGTNSITSPSEADSGLFLAYTNNTTGTYILRGTGTLSAAGSEGENVGYAGTGIFNQSAGSNVLTGFCPLYVGDTVGSTGTYVLSGTGSLSIAGNEYIGGAGAEPGTTAGGTGIFNQSGGNNSMTNPALFSGLFLAYVSGSTGTYILSDTGSLFVTGLAGENVGYAGIGFFNQSGGTNWLSGSSTLYLGNNVGATGTYTLGGTGSLSVSLNELIGDEGTGIFNQTGGKNIIPTGNLYIAFSSSTSFGTYYLSDPKSDPATLTLSSINTNLFIGTNGEFYIYGNSSTSITPGYFSGLPPGHSGSPPLGYVGGALYDVSGKVLIASGGAFHNDGGYVDPVELDVTGSFIQTNGIANFGQIMGDGPISLCGGLVSASGEENVGDNGNGSFNQTGGLNSIGADLNIAANPGSTGSYILGAGTLTVGGNVWVGGSSSGAGGTGVLTVSNTGQLSVVGSMTVFNNGSVNISGGNTPIGGLAISGGIVNVNTSIAINFGSRANDPINTIVGYLQSGYNGGAWTGTSGIVSTNAAASGRVATLGYLDGNIDTADSAEVGPNQILIQYTLVGDANLDGIVNFTDFAIVLKNFAQPGTDWAQGNFEYAANSPSIQGTNFNDFADVLKNFLQPLPGGGGAESIGGTVQPLRTTVQIVPTSVPEPTSVGILAAGAGGLLRRRKRKPCHNSRV